MRRIENDKGVATGKYNGEYHHAAKRGSYFKAIILYYVDSVEFRIDIVATNFPEDYIYVVNYEKSDPVNSRVDWLASSSLNE